jgi:catechol 2,3-dioxygenase-like lactoylglutathione lyase family enzyme
MAAVQITHLFAGVAVSDFAVACDWYERLFESPPGSLPTEGEAVWHPTPTASIYITVDPARAGHGLLALAVKDLEAQRVELTRRGLFVEEGAEAQGLRTLIVADPDGSRIKFFEDPAET